jgi:hypothetical protein
MQQPPSFVSKATTQFRIITPLSPSKSSPPRRLHTKDQRLHKEPDKQPQDQANKTKELEARRPPTAGSSANAQKRNIEDISGGTMCVPFASVRHRSDPCPADLTDEPVPRKRSRGSDSHGVDKEVAIRAACCLHKYPANIACFTNRSSASRNSWPAFWSSTCNLKSNFLFAYLIPCSEDARFHPSQPEQGTRE